MLSELSSGEGFLRLLLVSVRDLTFAYWKDDKKSLPETRTGCRRCQEIEVEQREREGTGRLSTPRNQNLGKAIFGKKKLSIFCVAAIPSGHCTRHTALATITKKKQTAVTRSGLPVGTFRAVPCRLLDVKFFLCARTVTTRVMHSSSSNHRNATQRCLPK